MVQNDCLGLVRMVRRTHVVLLTKASAEKRRSALSDRLCSQCCGQGDPGSHNAGACPSVSQQMPRKLPQRYISFSQRVDGSKTKRLGSGFLAQGTVSYDLNIQVRRRSLRPQYRGGWSRCSRLEDVPVSRNATRATFSQLHTIVTSARCLNVLLSQAQQACLVDRS